MTRYVALVDGKPGSYGLTVPDLPGCTSAAATIDQVLRRATQAVRLWAEDALADGEKLPKPRSIDALRADSEVAAALAEGRRARHRTSSPRRRPASQGQPLARRRLACSD